MTKLLIETKTALSDAGKWGAGLMVATQFVGAYSMVHVIASLDDPGGPSAAAVFGAFLSGVAFIIGGIMLFLGREYTHTVSKAEDRTTPRDTIPPFGGTEAERRNLGLK